MSTRRVSPSPALQPRQKKPREVLNTRRSANFHVIERESAGITHLRTFTWPTGSRIFPFELALTSTRCASPGSPGSIPRFWGQSRGFSTWHCVLPSRPPHTASAYNPDHLLPIGCSSGRKFLLTSTRPQVSAATAASSTLVLVSTRGLNLDGSSVAATSKVSRTAPAVDIMINGPVNTTVARQRRLACRAIIPTLLSGQTTRSEFTCGHQMRGRDRGKSSLAHMDSGVQFPFPMTGHGWRSDPRRILLRTAPKEPSVFSSGKVVRTHGSRWASLCSATTRPTILSGSQCLSRVMEAEWRLVRLASMDLIDATIGMVAGRQNLTWVEFECMSGTLWAARG